MQMLLTGELIDADTALRFGLINEHVPAAELEARTTALARQIASKSPLTLAMGSLYRPPTAHKKATFRWLLGLLMFLGLSANPYFLSLICFPLGSISIFPPSIARAFCMASWFAPSSCFWICW